MVPVLPEGARAAFRRSLHISLTLRSAPQTPVLPSVSPREKNEYEKVWLLLEEKRVPYKIGLVPMRSYGEKPRSFLEKVPNGLLPAIELDGRVHTESLDIMALLDATFPAADGAAARDMLPPRGTEEFERVEELLRLERQLFSAWCGYVFRAGGARARKAFEATLDQVDAALGATPGPWFLETDGPTLVDMQCVRPAALSRGFYTL